MSNRIDSYVVLATCVGLIAIAARALSAYQTIRSFDVDTTTMLAIVSSIFLQLSLCMAMFCAVIIGRHMMAELPVKLGASVDDQDPHGLAE